MADATLIGVRKKIDQRLDKARASSQINERDIFLLTGLTFHDDRTDNGYRLKRGLISFIEHANLSSQLTTLLNLILYKPTFLQIDLIN